MSQMITITTAADLNAALEAAVGGETFCLEAGHFGQLILNAATHPHLAFATPVTLTAVGAPFPTVFSGLHLSGVAHLVFEGIVFDVKDPDLVPDSTMVDAANIAASPSADAPFKLAACADIVFQGCIFQGKNGFQGQSGQGGSKISCGLTLSACRSLRIDTCRLQGFSHGIVVFGSETLTVTGCDLSTISMDAMLLIDTKAVRIEGNFLHDLGPQSAPNAPVTMLHFRTKTADRAHRDVILRNNTLDAGAGSAARGIVMTSDLGPETDLGPKTAADSETVFACDGLLIEGNLIVTSHADGIFLGPVHAVTIQNNSVLMGPSTPNAVGPAVAPQIMIDPRAQDVTVTRNAVYGIMGPGGAAPMSCATSTWTVRQNAFVQADDPTLPGWYGDVFETPPAEPTGSFGPSGTPIAARFVPRKGSMLHSLGAGVPSAPSTREDSAQTLVLENPEFVPKPAFVPKLSVVPRLMPPRLTVKRLKSTTPPDSPKRASAPATRAWTSSAFLDCSAPLM